jgi:hypothetical protein
MSTEMFITSTKKEDTCSIIVLENFETKTQEENANEAFQTAQQKNLNSNTKINENISFHHCQKWTPGNYMIVKNSNLMITLHGSHTGYMFIMTTNRETNTLPIWLYNKTLKTPANGI